MSFGNFSGELTIMKTLLFLSLVLVQALASPYGEYVHNPNPSRSSIFQGTTVRLKDL
jgi:hypothetical protein